MLRLSGDQFSVKFPYLVLSLLSFFFFLARSVMSVLLRGHCLHDLPFCAPFVNAKRCKTSLRSDKFSTSINLSESVLLIFLGLFGGPATSVGPIFHYLLHLEADMFSAATLKRLKLKPRLHQHVKLV